MLKHEQIPDEVIEAAKEAYRHTDEKTMSDWLAEIIAAGLAAWPGMEPHKVLTVRDNGEGYDLKQIGIILPLPQEVK
jgi:hypothetical protein